MAASHNSRKAEEPTMTDELKAAIAELRTAREELEATFRAQQTIKDRITAQRCAIQSAAAQLDELDEQAGESMTSPEAAEAWRTARAKVIVDRGGLAIQLQALETGARNCAETARRDKTRVAEAEAGYFIARLEVMRPQVREAFEVIGDAAALWSRRTYGAIHLDPVSFGVSAPQTPGYAVWIRS